MLLAVLVRGRARAGTLARRTAAPGGAVVAGVVVPLLPPAGWYLARNVRELGAPYVSSFQTKTQAPRSPGAADKKPLLERRSPSFVRLGHRHLRAAVLQRGPCCPSPHFFEVLTASTFADYWSYSFNGIPPGTKAWWTMNGADRHRGNEGLGRSVVGGTLIALATVAALAHLACSQPARARLGAFSRCYDSGTRHGFCLRSPSVPGRRLRCHQVDLPAVRCGPLYVAFGRAVAWTLERRRRWPLFALLALSLAAVAAYTVDCRL